VSEQIIAAVIGAAVVSGLKIVDRLLDWLLPQGGHFEAPWIHDEEHPANEKSGDRFEKEDPERKEAE
jgi:hypothetical protein